MLQCYYYLANSVVDRSEILVLVEKLYYYDLAIR